MGRTVALVSGAAVLASVTGLSMDFSRSVASQGHVPLHSAGIALAPDGTVSMVPAADRPAFHPNSRVLIGASRDDPAARQAARHAASRQQAWLADGDIPGKDTAYEHMARTALLDLETLVQPNGAALAGWSSSWRYVWPRDASFTAAALARTGHATDALQILTFLQGVQEPDGRFQARYLPDGTGEVPDDRGVQLDGAGWALWGAREWFDSVGAGAAQRELRTLDTLIRRSATNLISLVDPATGLTPASSDYWERRETALTLGTAAPVLAGLRAAPPLLTALGEHELARGSRAAAKRLEAGIDRTFGLRGYPRIIDGNQRDAAVAFLLPPFANRVRPAVHAAWVAAGVEMRQPAGGLSPGVGWEKTRGVTWTPQTALFALAAAASGKTELALAWTSWLDRHRTRLGALPEKVSENGKPGGVAPLAWTAALVVLTLDELAAHGRLTTDRTIPSRGSASASAPS